MLHDKYKNNNFEKYFEKFLELDLIRDWDFACYTRNGKKIDEKYRQQLDGLSEKNKMVQRAKTFILYQAKRPIKINNQALFVSLVL